MQFKPNETINSQLNDWIQRRIFCGYYAAGARLPSIRDLAVELKVNPNTVAKAYTELESTGLIYSESTNGKFVTSDAALVEKMKNEYIKQLVKDFLSSVNGMIKNDK